MSAAPESLDVLRFQVGQHAQDLRSLGHWRTNTDIKVTHLEGKIDALLEGMQTLSDQVATANRRVTTAIVTFAGGMVTFSFSILAATGHF